MAGLLLDLSRLFARADFTTPTGIDRVEAAYLNWALRREDTHFLVRIPGRDVIADGTTVSQALNTSHKGLITRTMGMTAAQAALALSFPKIRLKPGFIYLNVGHSNIKPRMLSRLDKWGMGRFIAMVHDTIPLDAPDVCRANQVAPAKARLGFICAQSDHVIAVSKYSAARLEHHAKGFGRIPQTSVIYPGIEISDPSAPAPTPYFVALGTIEPRKNIAFLLDIWEKMIAKPDIPQLHIVGKRGWENQELLERLDSLGETGAMVVEHRDMADRDMRALLRGARALLFPTLHEGFGLPLYEARAMGLSVIASDLPVLRELGEANTTYVPINDHAAWHAAIGAAIPPQKPNPSAVPTWDEHFAQLERLIEQQAPLVAAS